MMPSSFFCAFAARSGLPLSSQSWDLRRLIKVGKNHSPRKVSMVCRSDMKSPPGPTLAITSNARISSFTSIPLTSGFTWPMISSAITRKPRLLFLSMLVSSGPSERQAAARAPLESALVQHLGRDHVVDGERIFSMNMGIAVDDMVTAKVLYERALERG